MLYVTEIVTVKFQKKQASLVSLFRNPLVLLSGCRFRLEDFSPLLSKSRALVFKTLIR